MKRIFATTAILALSTGLASAEVTLSGDARMGILSEIVGGDIVFTSRARVGFALSGESDSGFSFGASFRADNAGDAASGTAGSVWIEGAFGKLSMGDVDGVGAAAVGQVDGVGLTGLRDMHEIKFLSSGGTDTNADCCVDTDDPSVLYEYSTGAATFYLGMTNPSSGSGGFEGITAYGLGAKYAFGDIVLSAAVEKATGQENGNGPRNETHVAVGVDATFGAVTLKARYGVFSGRTDNFSEADGDQYAISATYKADALSVTGFYSNGEDIAWAPASGMAAYGLGASYDLGGGASLVGGWARHDAMPINNTTWDLGLSFSF